MVESFQISNHIRTRNTFFNQMVTFIAQKPSFSSMMMYILEKKFCKTPADFWKISAGAGDLNFGRDPVDDCY